MIKNHTFQNAVEVFRKHNGILRTSQARQLGIAGATIPRMVKAGILVRESRGVYRLADMFPLSNPGLIITATRVPSAVFCLISALHFHNMTTQLPYSVHIALPSFKNRQKPRIDYPPLEIFWLSEKSYNAGIEQHIIDGVPVRIYNKEKTIADCFKYRHKIGIDVAIEALKDYLRQPGAMLTEVMKYARINRVANVMSPYMEALLHS